MVSEDPLQRLRQGLGEIVGRSGQPLGALSERLGRHPGYLGKVLHGRLKLKVREVFELLEILGLGAGDFFDLYFPLGGIPHARLRESAAAGV